METPTQILQRNLQKYERGTIIVSSRTESNSPTNQLPYLICFFTICLKKQKDQYLSSKFVDYEDVHHHLESPTVIRS